MADNSGMIKVAAIGIAAYVAYTQGWLSFLAGVAAFFMFGKGGR